MKRRISFAAITVAGISLALGVGIAPAVGKTGRRANTGGTPYKVVCNMTLTTVPPPNSTTVVAPSSQGNQYGGLECGSAPFNGGMVGDRFTVPDSGDTVGVYDEALSTGTIRGAFDLTPQQGEFGGGSTFQSQSWQGTISVTKGTGAFKGITSPRDGTMDCSSPDSVHLTCTETIRVVVPTSSS